MVYTQSSFKSALIIFSLAIIMLTGADTVQGTAADRVCDIDVVLLSQDPMPAMPGERVELVFQIYEKAGPCDGVSFKIAPDYPFALPRGEEGRIDAPGRRWSSAGYKRDIVTAFKLEVDEDAKDGWHELEVKYAEEDVSLKSRSKDVDIRVEDVRTEFEFGIRSYDPANGEITLEILNVGKNDVEALVLEIPQQENIGLIGSNRNIIGILDSNEDTSARFRVSDVEEGEMEVLIRYNDAINERREINETLYFNPDMFVEQIEDVEPPAASFYVALILTVLLVMSWAHGKRKRKKILEELKKKS